MDSEIKWQCEDEFLEIIWNSSHRSKYHWVWLKNHCRCDLCWDSFIQANFADGTCVESFHTVYSENGFLKIKWNSGHISKYSLNWLEKFCYSCGNHKNQGFIPIPELRLWALDFEIKFFDWEEVSDDDVVLQKLLTQFFNDGLIALDNVPKESEFCVKIGERIADHVKRTHLSKRGGNSFEETIYDPESDNVTQTNKYLPLHHDLRYYNSSARIQIFHCIENQATGGKSFYKDGFPACEKLRTDHPAFFKLLTETLVYFRSINVTTKYDIWCHTPIIVLNNTGDIVQFRNYPHVHPLTIPFDKTVSFYNALIKFNDLLREVTQYEIRWEAGQAVLIDNFRVLHGRNSFEGSEARHFQNCYIDDEFVRSKFVTLDPRWENNFY